MNSLLETKVILCVNLNMLCDHRVRIVLRRLFVLQRYFISLNQSKSINLHDDVTVKLNWSIWEKRTDSHGGMPCLGN